MPLTKVCSCKISVVHCQSESKVSDPPKKRKALTRRRTKPSQESAPVEEPQEDSGNTDETVLSSEGSQNSPPAVKLSKGPMLDDVPEEHEKGTKKKAKKLKKKTSQEDGEPLVEASEGVPQVLCPDHILK